MNPVDFCYWLQGYFELSANPAELTIDQVKVIRNHLNLVFVHSIDPSHPLHKNDKKLLQEAHNGAVVASGVPAVPRPRPGITRPGVKVRC